MNEFTGRMFQVRDAGKKSSFFSPALASSLQQHSCIMKKQKYVVHIDSHSSPKYLYCHSGFCSFQ